LKVVRKPGRRSGEKREGEGAVSARSVAPLTHMVWVSKGGQAYKEKGLEPLSRS